MRYPHKSHEKNLRAGNTEIVIFIPVKANAGSSVCFHGFTPGLGFGFFPPFFWLFRDQLKMNSI